MSGQIRSYTLTFGSVINTVTGEVCKNPTIEPAGSQDIAINCIDVEGCVYKVQIGPNDVDPCIKFIVTCGDCDACGQQVIEKCFCDDIDDCKPCETCVDGFCNPLCPPEKCVNGTCTDCTKDTDCPANKVCVNGKCVCPPNTTANTTGGCDECSDTVTCADPCEDCIFTDGFNKCTPKDCICDSTGICGEAGSCVECLNSGNCTGVNECCVNCICDCCAGFKKINGVCQQVECETDSQCDICEICKDNICQPIKCPPGEICVDGTCVPECDCDNDPTCTKRTDFCKNSSFDLTLCGCVPCQGTCADGCVDPCICDPIANVCVFNPCAGSCTNGTDCASRDCGCVDGECKPCFLLDCVTDECDRALGCGCSGINCIPTTEPPLGCLPTECSISSDCALGCTCFEGICTSCDNFSCVTSDCTIKEGCECVNGDCVGKKEDCTDTLKLEKSDINCTLTGTLTKNNCCSCPALTLNSKGQIVGEDALNYTFNFIGEVRKGSYDGVSADAKPRVDDFTHPDIAENEPPTSGTVSLIREITYNIYSIINGQEVFQGISVEAPGPLQATYPGTGDTAQVDFKGIVLPKIGSRVTEGTTIKEARSVEVAFFLSSTLVFPNQCNYTGSIKFADYDIQSDTDYQGFSTTSFSNPLAATVTSSDCRDPFFKWSKSDDGVFSAAPFRKIYIKGEGISFIDLLDKKEQGLESCKYYLLDVDCTCKEPVSEYVVFCNPENLDFTLANCSKCITINAFDTCKINEDITFRVQAGSLDFTWIGDNAPTEQQCSTIAIEQVIYSITCDTLGQCTQIYDSPSTELELNFTTVCTVDNDEFTVTFNSVDTTGTCAVDFIQIGTFTLSGTLTKVLSIGSYTAIVHWACGCDPTEISITEDCCDFVLSPCTRECGGNVDGCLDDPGVTYTVDGVLITCPGGVNCLRQYVEALSPSASVTIIASKGECFDKTISIPDLDSFCCENFTFKINQAPSPQAIIEVLNGSGNVTLTVVDTNGLPLLVTSLGNNFFEVTGIVEGMSYQILVTDVVCGAIQGNFVGGECLLIGADDGKLLEEFQDGFNCRYRAAVEPITCDCRDLTYIMNVLSVVDKGTSFDVYFDTELGGNDANPLTGELFIGEPDNLLTTGFIEGSGIVNIPKPVANSENCISALTDIIATDDNTDGIYTIEIYVNKDGIALINDPSIVSVSVQLDSVLLNSPNSSQNGQPIYLFIDFSAPNSGSEIVFRLEINAVHTDGTVFNYTTPAYGVEPFIQQTLATTLCAQTVASGDAVVKFELRSLTLEDNCDYFDAQNVTTSQEYLINSNGVVTPSNQTKLVIPNVRTARFVKFTWLRDNNSTPIHTEFVGAPTYTSTLPLADTIVGSRYDVEASCAPCSITEGDTLCCIPDSSFVITGCNDSMVVTLTGIAGTYFVDYDSVIYPITITASGIEAIAIPGPLVPLQAIIGVAGQPTCTEVVDVPLVVPCTPIVTYVCTGVDTYTATIADCGIPGGLSSISLTGGTGSVSGNQVTGINELFPAVVDIGDSNGCLLIGFSLAFICSIVNNPTPSNTASITATPGASVTPTPTVTPTVTPSIGTSSTPSPTISISPSIPASVTPTATPTISVSPTIGVTRTPTPTISVTISASSSPTISVTASITPSATVTLTPTISVTPTETPTNTPSNTASITVSPSISVTRSISISPTPTPTISITNTVTPSISISATPSVSVGGGGSPFCNFIGDTCGSCGQCDSGLNCVSIGGCNVCRDCVTEDAGDSYNCNLTDPDKDKICGSICYDDTVNTCCAGGTSA